jgi:PRTRC genetic system ThiF family protein
MPSKKRSPKSAPLRAHSHAAVLPIERIAVVGCGGNGSIFITHLCRIWQAWTKLGGSPFAIDIYDPDTVSETNLARQVFCAADIGQHKATVLAQRVRSFFGVPVKPRIERYTDHYDRPSVIVGCVDNLKARRAMAETCHTKTKHEGGCYWLDLGNSDTFGQVVLGGHGLRTYFDLYPHLRKAKDPEDQPSCSMAESLERQDLFVNSTIATLGGHLLWSLMRRGGLNHHGYVVNLLEGIVLPIPVEVTPKL